MYYFENNRDKIHYLTSLDLVRDLVTEKMSMEKPYSEEDEEYEFVLICLVAIL